jgi:predicted RNase H-like nuclease (RuvC/YqgF family)
MFNRSKLENEFGKLARQSGVLLETGKIKLQITQVENDIYNLKAQLGDLVYQAFANQTLQGTEQINSIEELCSKIAEAESRINQLKAEVERLNQG